MEGGKLERKDAPKPDLRLSPSLPPLEQNLYTAAWIGGVLLSLASLHVAGKASLGKLDTEPVVSSWWPGATLHRDATSHEWNMWKWIVRRIGLLALGFPLLSQGTKRWLPGLTLPLTTLYSILAITHLIGPLPILFIGVEIAVIFLAFLTRRAIVVWTVAVGYMLGLHLLMPLTSIDAQLFWDGSNEGFLRHSTTYVMLFWINSRCVSFSLDRIWGSVPTEPRPLLTFLHLVSFCFYLPCVMGPLVPSSAHLSSLARRSALPWRRALALAARLALWTAVTELSLLITFQNALSLRPAIVGSLGLWPLCGMGCALAQFLHIKYVVFYGWSCLLGQLDGLDTPPPPKCMGRIHLYSDMWRHFDHGLYIFMQRYIYRPVLGDRRSLSARLASSAVCFTFVYIWHGTLDYVMVWSALNFMGITVEGLARAVDRNPTYKAWEEARLSPRMSRRLHALLAAPLLLMSCLSSMYFCTGLQVGNVFVRRVVLEAGPVSCLTLLAFLYSACQTAIEVKNWETRRAMALEKERSE